MSDVTIQPVHAGDVPPDHRRGGAVRTLLSPRSVGSTSGFMGVATLEAGGSVSEHYHPYSEEFLYLVRGTLTARLDGEPTALTAGDAVLLPKGTRHRLENHGTEEAFFVFHLGPLAPRPDLGHVDTETPDPPGEAADSPDPAHTAARGSASRATPSPARRFARGSAPAWVQDWSLAWLPFGGYIARLSPTGARRSIRGGLRRSPTPWRRAASEHLAARSIGLRPRGSA